MRSERYSNHVELEVEAKEFTRHPSRRGVFIEKNELKNQNTDPPKTLEQIIEEAEKQRQKELNTITGELMALEVLSLGLPMPIFPLKVAVTIGSKYLEKPNNLEPKDLKDEIPSEIADQVKALVK